MASRSLRNLPSVTVRNVTRQGPSHAGGRRRPLGWAWFRGERGGRVNDGDMPGAGWYPDPEGKPAERYWDGDDWTGRIGPMSREPAGSPEHPESIESAQEQSILVNTCPACSASNPFEHTACSHCGASLAKASIDREGAGPLPSDPPEGLTGSDRRKWQARADYYREADLRSGAMERLRSDAATRGDDQPSRAETMANQFSQVGDWLIGLVTLPVVALFVTGSLTGAAVGLILGIAYITWRVGRTRLK